ncbi:hypothetical protein BJX61DRAFT_552588 [Aspergillus egyptiacus]|nr:hypothetical protein BJX61DRAFT_552588 [Aspergillus egyptiacus]
MPVTLNTAAHPSEEWRRPNVSSAEELLKQSSPSEAEPLRQMIQSSFPPSLFGTSLVSPSEHGFIWAVVHAYSHHHRLIIRPEDVWFTILTQLSFFVNAHAEELRSAFEYNDFGGIAERMAGLIDENVVDKDLRDWIMPDFSTTTKSDKAVAAILMMGVLQKYFSYKVYLLCGIPSVTLLGDRGDWARIVAKLDKLQQLGDEPARFAQLLRPILNHFVLPFDRPESPEVLSFWSKCAHRISGGSGPDYLSGWVSAFAFWDAEGKLLNRTEPIHPVSSSGFMARNTELGLDDVLSRKVETQDIPPGLASVPVTVNDNGREFETVMLAGLVGIQVLSTGGKLDGTAGQDARLDTIQPLSGWWICEKAPSRDAEEQDQELL